MPATTVCDSIVEALIDWNVDTVFGLPGDGIKYQDVAVFNQRLMGPSHVANLVDLACRTALSRRGPAHICIPIDIQVAPISDEHRSKRNLPGHTSRACR